MILFSHINLSKLHQGRDAPGKVLYVMGPLSTLMYYGSRIISKHKFGGRKHYEINSWNRII